MAGSRVVAVIEAVTVTGPAKNLLRFAARARSSTAAEISILTFNRSQQSNPFLDAARSAGLEADVIDERFRFDPGVMGQLTALLQRRSPDIVQTHGVKAHFLVRAGGLARRYPWIAFHHGYTAEDLKMRLYNQLDRWSLPGADRVVTVCTPFAEALARRGVPPSNQPRLADRRRSTRCGGGWKSRPADGSFFPSDGSLVKRRNAI